MPEEKEPIGPDDSTNKPDSTSGEPSGDVEQGIDLSSSDQTPSIPNMEVHHHPEVGKKNFKEYLLEGLMIFLAVTLGFFAENIREEVSNSKKEKHIIQSLVEDIKSDTAQLNDYIRFKTSRLYYCDSLQMVIAHGNVFQNSDSFYNYSRELRTYSRYYPADRTIEQLKAGNMQLIHNWDVSNAISEYYSMTKFMQEADLENNDEVIRYRRYMIEFLDLSSYDKLNEPGSYMNRNVLAKGNPAFISTNPEKLKIIYNETFTLRTFIINSNQNANLILGLANQLLQLLDKEYGLNQKKKILHN